MAARKSQNWLRVKAKIILRYGSITECAHALGCSSEAIRKSVEGKCPKVAQRLEAALSK